MERDDELRGIGRTERRRRIRRWTESSTGQSLEAGYSGGRNTNANPDKSDGHG